MQLDWNNEWVLPGDRIAWNSLEEKYAAMFPSAFGPPAKPLRMALGGLIIQKRKKLSDRALVASRKRLDVEFLIYKTYHPHRNAATTQTELRLSVFSAWRNAAAVLGWSMI